MKAAQLIAFGKPLEIRDVDKPTPKGEEVLIRVAGAGICHSDLHLIEGKFPLPFLPITLGHENTGFVEELGENSIGFEIGDPVAVYGAWNTFNDRFSLKGEGNLSNVSDWEGVGHHGGYAEYLLVKSYRYLLHLGDLDPIESVPLVDAGLTSFRAVNKLKSAVYPGATVVIIGAGGQGQFGIQYSKLVLPQVRTVAVDINETRLKEAIENGADITINNSKENLRDKMIDITRGEGCQGVIDFVGSTETLNLAYSILGRQGKLVIVGLSGGKLEIVPDMLVNEAEVTTSNWGTMLELSEVLYLAKSGRLRIDYETISLDSINKAFDKLRERKNKGRIVIIP